MEKNTTTFETGASSAAVNELILYTDNTRELAELRDLMYEERATVRPHLSFRPLQFKAMNTYLNEFVGQDVRHIRMNENQIDEYCQIYANRFAEWKKEKERNSK